MILGCDFIIALKGFFFAGKLGVLRVVPSQISLTRAFSIRVLITRNVVPTVIEELIAAFKADEKTNGPVWIRFTTERRAIQSVI